MGSAILSNAFYTGHRFTVWHSGGCGHILGGHETIPQHAQGNDSWGMRVIPLYIVELLTISTVNLFLYFNPGTHMRKHMHLYMICTYRYCAPPVALYR